MSFERYPIPCLVDILRVSRRQSVLSRSAPRQQQARHRKASAHSRRAHNLRLGLFQTPRWHMSTDHDSPSQVDTLEAQLEALRAERDHGQAAAAQARQAPMRPAQPDAATLGSDTCGARPAAAQDWRLEEMERLVGQVWLRAKGAYASVRSGHALQAAPRQTQHYAGGNCFVGLLALRCECPCTGKLTCQSTCCALLLKQS